MSSSPSSDALTPEDLQKGYETLILAEFKPQEQLHARHILVDTKEAAEKIIADLKGGASFEELAKQSKDPSGQNGGDLGFFGRGQMVPAFEDGRFRACSPAPSPRRRCRPSSAGTSSSSKRSA